MIDTFVADVTGDDKDDLVISSQDSVVGPTEITVRVIPSGAPIGEIMLQRDTACTAP